MLELVFPLSNFYTFFIICRFTTAPQDTAPALEEEFKNRRLAGKI
jgi:hypothetical protein